MPLRNSFQPVIPEQNLGQPTEEGLVQPGDLMYIPCGLIHHADTTDSFSFHMILGVHPIQWMDLLPQTLMAISLKDERFRRALPPGFLEATHGDGLAEQFTTLLAMFADQANVQETFAMVNYQFLQSTTPVPDRHLTQLNEISSIMTETLVEKQRNMDYQLPSF